MRSIVERIADLQGQRTKAVNAMSELLDLAETENRTSTETENVQFEDAQTKVKSLDEQIAKLEAMAAVQKAAAKAATDGGAYGEESSATTRPRIQVVRNLPPGTAFTRFAIALMASKGSIGDAERLAKARWNDTTPEVSQVLRAAVAAGTTTDPVWAGTLVEYQTMASEFIELLRPDTIIGQIPGFRRVPFNIRIPRQTAGATAGWVGEGKSKPVSRLSFDAIQVPFSKIAVIAVITEELARFSSPSAEALVQADLRKAITEFMNQQFIDPSVAGTPGLSPESITHAGTSTPSTGDTVAAVMADVATLLTNMALAGMTGPFVWVMHPRTVINLSMLRTAQDVYAFPEVAQGRFRGYPIVQSTAVPMDGTTGETIMVLLSASEILLADDGDVTLDVSREASLQLDDSPTSPPSTMVSLWQQNMLGLRAERFIYWMLRNSAAVQVLTGVTY